MTDRADELAKELSRQLYVEGVPLGTGVAMIADTLRAYAEEARREEREACAAALCPFCAGTAIKAGVFDVVSIGLAERCESRMLLPSSGRVVTRVRWRHWVVVDAPCMPSDQPCHAAAIRARGENG